MTTQAMTSPPIVIPSPPAIRERIRARKKEIQALEKMLKLSMVGRDAAELNVIAESIAVPGLPNETE